MVDWLYPNESGLYCKPGNFYIDPWRPVNHALITHGHADHARTNNENVLCTHETQLIMKHRYGAAAGKHFQVAKYGETLKINDTRVSFFPAGHIWGSAQILICYKGHRLVISGDYKRRPDPTCPQFEPVPCETFITEATFGMPVFTHPDDGFELRKLIQSMFLNEERVHLVGCYALGKCQRIILRLRELGYHNRIYLHGSMIGLIDLYKAHGFDFGDIGHVSKLEKDQLSNQLVLCPPSALKDRWSRRFDNPVIGFASGWMRILQRAKQKGVELPIVISDHADWPELIQTLHDINPIEVLVTHGREESLLHYAKQHGFDAHPLSIFHAEGEED